MEIYRCQYGYYWANALTSDTGSIIEENMAEDETMDSIFTYNTCRRCISECSTGIDVPELVIYARHYISKN